MVRKGQSVLWTWLPVSIGLVFAVMMALFTGFYAATGDAGWAGVAGGTVLTAGCIIAEPCGGIVAATALTTGAGVAGFGGATLVSRSGNTVQLQLSDAADVRATGVLPHLLLESTDSQGRGFEDRIQEYLYAREHGRVEVGVAPLTDRWEDAYAGEVSDGFYMIRCADGLPDPAARQPDAAWQCLNETTTLGDHPLRNYAVMSRSTGEGGDAPGTVDTCSAGATFDARLGTAGRYPVTVRGCYRLPEYSTADDVEEEIAAIPVTVRWYGASDDARTAIGVTLTPEGEVLGCRVSGLSGATGQDGLCQRLVSVKNIGDDDGDGIGTLELEILGSGKAQAAAALFFPDLVDRVDALMGERNYRVTVRFEGRPLLAVHSDRPVGRSPARYRFYIPVQGGERAALVMNVEGAASGVLWK